MHEVGYTKSSGSQAGTWKKNRNWEDQSAPEGSAPERKPRLPREIKKFVCQTRTDFSIFRRVFVFLRSEKQKRYSESFGKEKGCAEGEGKDLLQKGFPSPFAEKSVLSRGRSPFSGSAGPSRSGFCDYFLRQPHFGQTPFTMSTPQQGQRSMVPETWYS